ncbi:MAG: hypothetical protein KDI07_19255 [Anaerolineae bacterium]|nr:hypothetical protein [Anaerolineae bacterium]MCB0250720.1 hypothetical protein [Anaerolineae bacterium]
MRKHARLLAGLTVAAAVLSVAGLLHGDPEAALIAWALPASVAVALWYDGRSAE